MFPCCPVSSCAFFHSLSFVRSVVTFLLLSSCSISPSMFYSNIFPTTMFCPPLSLLILAISFFSKRVFLQLWGSPRVAEQILQLRPRQGLRRKRPYTQRVSWRPRKRAKNQNARLSRWKICEVFCRQLVQMYRILEM